VNNGADKLLRDWAKFNKNFYTAICVSASINPNFLNAHESCDEPPNEQARVINNGNVF
jgi:hypothetical protein